MQFMRKAAACIICLLLCGICLTFASNIETLPEGDEVSAKEFAEIVEEETTEQENGNSLETEDMAEEWAGAETDNEETGAGTDTEGEINGETETEEEEAESGDEEEGTDSQEANEAEEGEAETEEEAETEQETEVSAETGSEAEPDRMFDAAVPLRCECCIKCPLCYAENGLPVVEICACYDENWLYLGCGCECVIFEIDATREEANEETLFMEGDNCEPDCSCRLGMASSLAAPMVHTDGGAIVFTFSQLRQAIETDGYTLVYLGYGTEDANGETKNDGHIAFAGGGIKVTQNITIVGTDPRSGRRVTLEDYTSSLPSDTIYATVSGSTIQIRDVNIIGHNFCGIVYGARGMATTAEFSNVSYTGRQIACLYGSGTCASFSGCDIRIQEMDGNSGQEVAEATEIRLYGTNTMVRNAVHFGVSWPMFWLNGSPYKMTVDGTTTLETNNYVIYDDTSNTQLTVNGALHVKTSGSNGCMTYAAYSMASCSVKGALNISHEGGGYHSLQVGNLNVSGTLTIDKPANSNACVYLAPGGSATFSSPRLVRLRNPSGPLMRSAATTAPVSIATQVLNYWASARKNIWNQNDLSAFAINFSVNTSGAVSGITTNLLNLTGAAHQAVPLNTTNLTFSTGPQVSFGEHMVTIDELVAGRREVAGAASGGEQTVEEYGYVAERITNLLQSAVASGNYWAVMEQPIQKSSLVYVKSRTSDLEAHIYAFPRLDFYLYEVPDTMDFGTVAVSAQARFVRRVDPDWKISVMDYRDAGEFWKLYAGATPLYTADGIQLDGEMMFVSGSDARSMQGVEVMVAEQTLADFDSITDIKWPQDEGICIYLNSFAGEPDRQYGATISWTLTLGP